MRRRQFKNNSIGSALRLPTITLLLFGCVFLLGTSSAFAVPIPIQLEIQFTGVNLSYDGNTISDAVSAGGLGDPNDADPLDSIQFKVDGVLQNLVLPDDIFLDVSIPGVTGLSDMDPFTITTSGDGGYFHLLFDTDPNALEFLKLGIDDVTITYVNTLSTVQFVFGASIAMIDDQKLPAGLKIGDTVTVSFSTQVDAGSKTIDGDIVDGFTAWGTGEVIGTLVPEPSSYVLGAIGLAASCACRRRWW